MAKSEKEQVDTEPLADTTTLENNETESPPPGRGWEGMTVPALQRECRRRNLCRTGEKKILVNRLRAHDRPGQAGKFTGGGAVKCRVCGAPARVTGTKRQTLDGGKEIIVRSVRCEGKKVHKDKLVEDA